MAVRGPDDLEAFQRRLAARRRSFQLLSAAAAALGLALAFASFVVRVVRQGRSSPPPPGIEVDIDAGGRTSVRGCRDAFEICVSGAAERERNRPGGGRYRALVRVAGGAPEDAIRDARRILMANEFMPASR